MSSLNKELIFLILQFLGEEKYGETVHKLEQESGFYFNMTYFQEEVLSGNWDEVERYLSGFTKLEDNRYSMKVFFEIRKQKYLEALDRQDRPRAVDILVKDLKVFAAFNENLFKEITQLLILDNFRENEQLSRYGDTKSARAIMLIELKKLIEANPVFRDKLHFPALKNSRLRTLINQSLNWQHQLCKNPRTNPDIKSLFIDHTCGQTSGARAPSPGNTLLLGPMSKAGGPPLGAQGPSQRGPAALPAPLAPWMSNPPTNPAASDHVSSQTSPIGISHEAFSTSESDEFPKTLARILNQGSCPTSMDFHPIQQTLLLVGTNIGEMALWDVCSRETLVQKSFKVWDLASCTMAFQTTIGKDPSIAVNRVMWSPEGSLLGVAYSRHIVQIYSYRGGDDVKQHFEVDAHVGGVNDLAFSHPNKLCVITCGDDKTIKVWDAASGVRQYIFEGHQAPVYSICPHYKENIQFIFSTAMDGKIKAWLYDNMGSRVDYDAPGQWCTTMAYSGDGSRLFSCGTSKDGESYIVEWNESEGVVKRSYKGFRKRSSGVVQFDTTKNRFLAAGDEFVIKVWDMDNINLLTTVDTGGGLPASPRIRFNKDGTFLAVSTNDNGIKVLATTDGLRLLQAFERLPFDPFRIVPETATKPISPISSVAAGSSAGPSEKAVLGAATTAMNGDTRNSMEVNPRLSMELNENSNNWKLTEIKEAAQLRTLRLQDNMRTNKISRLMYTNSGSSILALASNAIHFLWRWPRSDRSASGKATASVSPILWQPASGILMVNDIAERNSEEAVPCFALSKNDSYVMSASGGKISLFNLLTFKTMATFTSPPPAATFIAFHPLDNNILAVGMEDSTIQISNVRTDEVKSKLKGHSKRITGLAFSETLKMLVSSGADAQLCTWSSYTWEKQKSRFLQIPSGRSLSPLTDVRVQFHHDQIHFLAVHETQLAIYETTKLECVKQWVQLEPSTPISHATFSCDSQIVYATFLDATICIFTATHLQICCRIHPIAYLPPNVRSIVYPIVVAAHPTETNQFAVGLTDGGVSVFEPLESEGKWGVPPSIENGSDSNMQKTPGVGSSSSDQAQK